MFGSRRAGVFVCGVVWEWAWVCMVLCVRRLRDYVCGRRGGGVVGSPLMIILDVRKVRTTGAGWPIYESWGIPFITLLVGRKRRER